MWWRCAATAFAPQSLAQGQGRRQATAALLHVGLQPPRPDASRPIASQRSAPRSLRPQTLCCRPIRLASGAILRASAATHPTCPYEKALSGGNPGQEPRLLLHPSFALTQNYCNSQKITDATACPLKPPFCYSAELEGIPYHLKQIIVGCSPWPHGQRSGECPRASLPIEKIPTSPLCQHGERVIFVQHPSMN